MEIAKLRAARLLFSKLAESYGVSEENSKMRIHARTSDYTKTYFDPYVNILRTTTEAFSAIIGGCDSLHVSPFDIEHGLPEEFSNRLARNQQLILLEESHLNAVNDPAGGSYYVESLTYELIQHSWDFFLSIEQNGGILEAIDNDFIIEKINKSHDYRIKNIETRKDSIVGTSIFVNLNEKPLIRKDRIEEDTNPLLHKRNHSNSFNEIRMHVEFMDKNKEIFIANIGNAIKNKPRIDFAIGFFEPAGFTCSTNEGFENADTALDYVLRLENDIIVVCSTDDQYPLIIPEFAQKFKEKAPHKILVLAGYPKEHIETFKEAGVDFFVYMRANVVQTINEIIKKL